MGICSLFSKAEGKTMNKRRVHDGIVGLLVAITVVLGFVGNPQWLIVPGLLGLTMFQSALTGFCPVYYTLDRIQPDH